MSSILGAIARPPYATDYTSGTTTSQTYDDVSELDLSAVTSTTGSASVSLSSDLSSATASTETGQLALGFAQALDSATTVDQTTGQRELKAGQGDALVAALNSLLMQHGFTQDQATAVTTTLSNELSSGSPLSLSGSFDSLSASSVSATGAYGANGVWTAHSVTQTEMSGTLNLSVDASGQLNIALNSQTVSTAKYTGEVKGTGAMSAPVVVIDVPGLDGTTGSVALTAGSIGATSGSPAFASFDQANQAALSAMENALPDVLKNGLTAPDANSPVKETEADTAIAAASTQVMLLTTRSIAGQGAQGSGGDAGTNAQGDSSSATDVASDGTQGSSGTNPDGSSGDSALTTLLSAAKSEATALKQLLDSVSKTTLSGSGDATKRLKDLLDAARRALDGEASTSATGSSGADSTSPSDATGSSNGSGVAGTNTDGTSDATNGSSPSSTSSASSASLSIEISYTQTISMQLVDEQGYGSTLYARPDGSLGKIVTQPTYATA